MLIESTRVVKSLKSFELQHEDGITRQSYSGYYNRICFADTCEN